MTRKDYILIADAIATVDTDYKGLHSDLLSEVVTELAKRLIEDNPRFNSEVFIRAALPTKYGASASPRSPLRAHVTGAIMAGEGEAIIEQL